MENIEIVRLFSRQTLSATIMVDKIQTQTPSPPGSRSRANSYDLECYHQLAKEFEKSGKVYFSDVCKKE